MVSACAAGKVSGHLVLDLTDKEDKEGEADLPLAYMSNLNAITLLQMDGMLTEDELKQAINLAVKGCKQIYQIQKEALKARYVEVKETIKEEAEEE
jgi:exosome complex component RRP41